MDRAVFGFDTLMIYFKSVRFGLIVLTRMWNTSDLFYQSSFITIFGKISIISFVRRFQSQHYCN